MTAAIRAERLSALATPTALILLVASMLMAPISMIANLSVIDDLVAEGDDALRLAMHASTVATLVFALVTGVYAASTDHRFGIVDQRLLSEPNRSRVLTAKAVVSGGVGLGYGLLGGLVAVVAGTTYYSARGASFDLDSAIVLRSLAGLLLAAPLFAVIGVGVGTIVRSQPAAMSGALVWMLIIEPTTILGLPSAGRWFPGSAGLALTYSPDDALLPQGSAAALLALYALVTIGLAAHRFAHADI